MKKFPNANPYKIYIEVITKYNNNTILIYNEKFISILVSNSILKIYFYISSL